MRSERWFLLPVAALAIAVGVGVPYISNGFAIALAIVAAFSLIGFVLRKLMSKASRLRGLPTVMVRDDGRFRAPRLLMYAGLLTTCWLQLRFSGVTLSDALFLGALVWAFVEWTSTPADDTASLPRGVWVGIWLFVAGAGISTFVYSVDKLSSVGVIARVFYLVAAWFWLGGVSLRTPEHIWTAVKCWVASAAVCGVWALGQKYAHLPGGIQSGRVAGLSDGPNDLGALCACTLIPGLALAYRDRRWMLAVVGVAVGLTLSASIGSGFAALAALAFCLISRDLTRVAAISLTVGALALLLASPLIGSSAITRFSTATTAGAAYNQDTLYTRVRSYKAAWQRIRSEPFAGTGLDMQSSSIYDSQTGRAYQVHNLFLGRWYDSGILGLIGILVLVGTIGVAGWRLVIKSPDRYLAIALFAGFIAYVGDEMSEPSLYKRYSLVPALLIIALRANAIRLSRAESVRNPVVAPSRERHTALVGTAAIAHHH